MRWMKRGDKSFTGSKPACAGVFTDRVGTETARVVCFQVCVCVCVCVCACTCGPSVQPHSREALRVRYMRMAVSHGRAVDVVTDSLVKFQ